MSRKPFQQLLCTSTSQNMILVRSTVSSQHQTSCYQAAQAIALAHTSITQRQNQRAATNFIKDAESKVESKVESKQNEQIILLTMEVERLRSMLATGKQHRMENQALQEKCRDLERQRDAVYGRILQLEKQMTDDIRRRDDKLEEAYRKIKAMHQANIGLAHELNTLKARQNEIQYSSEKQQTEKLIRMTILQKELSTTQTEYSQLKRQFTEEKQKHQSAIMELNHQIQTTMEQERTKHQKDVENMNEKHNEQIRRLENMLRDAKYEAGMLRNQLSTRSAKQIEINQVHKTQIERITSDKQKQFEEQLKKLNRLFRDKENSFQNQRKSLISNITSIRVQRDRLQKQLIDSQNSKQELEQHIRNNTQFINQNKQQIQQLAQTINKMQSHSRNYESSIQELNKDKQELIETVNHLECQLQRRKSEQPTMKTTKMISDLQYQLELQKKKANKLEQQLSAYSQQAAAHVKAEIENKMLREETQKLYQKTLELQDRLRQSDRNALCDITFTNRAPIKQSQNEQKGLLCPRDYESMTVTIGDKRRVCSLERRRDTSQKQNRLGLATNPPSAERPAPTRQTSVTRLDTFNTNSSIQSSNQCPNTQPRTIPDFTDPFISDDNNILRNKLSQKNLLPDPKNRQPSFRGSYGHSRNMLYQREKMNQSILKRCQQLLTANRMARV